MLLFRALLTDHRDVVHCVHVRTQDGGLFLLLQRSSIFTVFGVKWKTILPFFN